MWNCTRWMESVVLDDKIIRPKSEDFYKQLNTSWVVIVRAVFNHALLYGKSTLMNDFCSVQESYMKAIFRQQ